MYHFIILRYKIADFSLKPELSPELLRHCMIPSVKMIRTLN